MFGNPSNSGGSVSPFGAMGESTSDGWMDALVERRQRLKQLGEQRALRDEFHNEMMDLIGQFNELREKYDRTCLDRDLCAAARDVAFEILKENKDRLGLTHEQIGQRINSRREKARAEFEASMQE